MKGEPRRDGAAVSIVDIFLKLMNHKARRSQRVEEEFLTTDYTDGRQDFEFD